MDEIKNKIKNVMNKPILTKQVKVPEMGFSEYFIQHTSLVPETYSSTKKKVCDADDSLDGSDPSLAKHKLPDEEILESIEAVYYEEDTEAGLYELKRLTEDGNEFNLETIDRNMKVLRQQQKVISKKVLQLILDQRTACTSEFQDIDETQKKLQESVWTCQKARSYLNYAKQQLTTSSLEILAAYRKREIILNLLQTLRTLKQIKMADQTFQQLISRGEYSAAIKCLLDTKSQTEKYKQYHCIESFTQKIQDTLIMTEVQLDEVLNSLTSEFDAKKYTKLQEAFMLLGKAPIAMDQLHMNFISSIHSTAFSVLKGYIATTPGSASSPGTPQHKLLFEQLCENIPAERYIDCLINLCKSFWKILVCYHQIVLWHQHNPLTAVHEVAETEISHDEYVHQKLKKGQFRIWNDIQAKICLYINSSRLHQLKYEHFIQALSIMQRLKKVGLEFCDEPSEKLMETIRTQSVEFFQRYHRSCLEEIALFVDHEAWVQITSFVSVTQLQEYKTVKRALQRYKTNNVKDENRILPLLTNGNGNGNNNNNKLSDNDSVSVHDADEQSSIYGSCGYFLRFSEKSSPFDGGFDEAMLEEDILAGIADESSCYYSEDSDDCGDVSDEKNGNESQLIINNTSLTVLRCIGRYLQMCRLLYSISPQIVLCMTELIDYFMCAVHEMFTKDLNVPGENLYSPLLAKNLNRILDEIIPKVKKWPPSFGMIEHDIVDPETVYGLAKRAIAVESCICLLEQFQQLRGYLDHLMAAAASDERQTLDEYFTNAEKYARDLRKPVYMCSMARVVDLQAVLQAMSKVKWDINQISSVHSSYIDTIHRAVQTFAMRLEQITTMAPLPREALWDSLAHILTHTLVEGFSNAKKCSTGGRALMQLDFTHFLSLFDLISGKKFPEHTAFVEQYVKAYYLPKDLLEEFIATQTNYSSKQMTGLINCACSNDKKTRQKLLAMIEKDNKNGSKENILT
ncbi:syndetin [Culicoides brevitarsis]|uniref:syndetin n=1 Tax=Culicoides brevitarsis TaxID=469753 RepID=UPI00307C49CD